jgi:hypothetical protein
MSMSLWVSTANAIFTFSNVSYTEKSVTFTIDGDMSGYEAPVGASGAFVPDTEVVSKQFTILYGGDISAGSEAMHAGDDTLHNTWSRSVFDNKRM